jgi:hypothetical protein
MMTTHLKTILYQIIMRLGEWLDNITIYTEQIFAVTAI